MRPFEYFAPLTIGESVWIVGGPSIVAGAGAVGNAAAEATGVRLNDAPITPEGAPRALGKIQ